MNAGLTTEDKLAELFDDCLEGPGDPAMIAPMLKAAKVLESKPPATRADDESR